MKTGMAAATPDSADAAPVNGARDAGERGAPSADAPRTMSQEFKALWRELPGLVTDRVELLSLELQRAGAALVQAAMLVVAATVLGVTVWLLAWAAAISAMVDAGLSMALALALVLVVNAAAAWWAIARARSLLARVPLVATFRHLTPKSLEDGNAAT